jgi:C4-dicarboxylate-specific signal transduction histidine kinase
MRYSLGFILALSLAGLQFLAIISVVSTSYVSSERAMLVHARGLMNDAGIIAAEHTKRFLEPAGEAIELASGLLEQDIVSAKDPLALERYLFQHLKTESQLSGLYYGDEAGNFVYVMRSDGPAPYRTKFVHVQGEDRTTELIWRRDNFAEVTRTEDPSDTYDPRQRQWYKDASTKAALIWTQPYIFFSSQRPGISVAAPVLSASGARVGIIGGDVEISDISEFLSRQTIGDRGSALILDDQGHVIAQPVASQIKVENADGTLGFVDIRNFSDPVARAAFADFTQVNANAADTRAQQSVFRYAGDKYMSLLLPVSGIDLPWTIGVFAPENDFIQGIKDNRRRNIWIAAVISLLSAIAGLALAGLILRPVRAFAVRTALVSQGEVSTKEPLPRTYQELRKANHTLINEIAQRRSSDAKIQELNRDLSHFSRINLMGQMASGLAHELSQPLTAITQNVDTAISVAKLNPIPTEELLSILAELDEQAHQGGDIIRSLRGFVRRDEARADLFDFKGLILQTCRLMRSEIEAHEIKIETRIADGLPLGFGNRVQIAQVLVNLMRNSVAAMVTAESPHKTITITAQHLNGQIEVWVEDTGPGVAKDVTLFKQFQTSKRDGLGLGLSISRTIIDANAGRLWHDRTHQQTTRFCFTVPVGTL